MNWTLIIIVGVCAIALIIFLVMRNQKDESEYEENLKNDYHKPNAEDVDIDSNKVIK